MCSHELLYPFIWNGTGIIAVHVQKLKLVCSKVLYLKLRFDNNQIQTNKNAILCSCGLHGKRDYSTHKIHFCLLKFSLNGTSITYFLSAFAAVTIIWCHAFTSMANNMDFMQRNHKSQCHCQKLWLSLDTPLMRFNDCIVWVWTMSKSN